MVDAMLICGIEAIILLAQAYYVEQARLLYFILPMFVCSC